MGDEINLERPFDAIFVSYIYRNVFPFSRLTFEVR